MTSFFCSLASDIYSFSSLSVIVELLIPCSYNCRLVLKHHLLDSILYSLNSRLFQLL